jgi:hypothetical protein
VIVIVIRQLRQLFVFLFGVPVVVEYHDGSRPLLGYTLPIPADVEYRVVWRGRCVHRPVAVVLDYIFTRFGPQGKEATRPLTVGDRVTVGGVAYVCAPVGWWGLE